MAIKAKISTTDFDKLSDDAKKFYKAEGNDYILDIEGGEDVGALKRAKEHEVGLKNKALKDLADANKRIEELQTEAAKGNTDVQKAVDDVKKTFTKQVTDLTTENEALKKNVGDSLLNGKAKEIAAKLFRAPDLAARAVRERMRVDFTDNAPKLVVLGPDGKDSNISFENLEKELAANPEFKDILIQSRATGGGAPAQPSGGGAPGRSMTQPPSYQQPPAERAPPGRQRAEQLVEAIRARKASQSGG